MREVGGQKSEIGGKTTEGRTQRSEGRGQMTDDGGQKAEFRIADLGTRELGNWGISAFEN